MDLGSKSSRELATGPDRQGGRATSIPWRPPQAAAKAPVWPRFGAEQALEVPRRPLRLSREAFYAAAYPAMLLSRRLEEKLLELFRKGYVKGTVTISIGNEATAIGASMPMRPAHDVTGLLHRDFGAHLLFGATPYELICQYMANAQSPTHGREGNVHHGNAAARRYPMMSHLGRMLSVVVGGVWAARRQGEHVVGLAPIGDGGSSTGEFHEAINLASVHRVPVLFLIENNGYSFSTPTELQFRCERLSDRAIGYGAPGRTVDGTDPWEVYEAACSLVEGMADDPGPALLECLSIRMQGHAAYDKAEYVSPEQREQLSARDPLPRTRHVLLEVTGCEERHVEELEQAVVDVVEEATAKAIRAARPRATSAGTGDGSPDGDSSENQAERLTFARATAPAAASNSAATGDLSLPSFSAARAKNGDAVRMALEYLLEHRPAAFLAGQDVGPYGSAFKTCKGLFDRFGAERVMDLPICESATVGFALGASQMGAEPIIEFQFADFATEAATQIGLNCGTWFYRAGQPAPVLMRLPCGGGLTMGMFHSGEYEGLWSSFPGLKVLYPVTPQETFEALVAGLLDPNPVLVLENKLLYWSRSGAIEFDGNTADCWQPRCHRQGDAVTVVAYGSMVGQCVKAAEQAGIEADVWNPWLVSPMRLEPIRRSLARTGRLLVVQEASAGMGVGERVIGRLCCSSGHLLKASPRIVQAPSTPVPFAPELETEFRPSVERIAQVMGEMAGPAKQG